MKRWIALRLTSADAGNALTQLSELAHTVSSQLLVHHNRTVLLEIEGSVALFGGVRGIKRHLQALLASVETPVLASIAGSALGAWLLVQDDASQKWSYACTQRTLARRLDALPLAFLAQAQPHLQWLENIGCVRLSDLRQLPRAEVLRRTSGALLEAVDQAYGLKPFLYRPAVLPSVFYERHSLSYRLVDLTALGQRLKPMVQRFSVWLTEQQLAVRSLDCQLHHTDRHRAHRPTLLTIRFSEPAWHVPTIMALLNAQLEAVRLPAAVTHITLMSRVLAARLVKNHVLFESREANADAFKKTMDLLRARLGSSAVRQAQPQADYRPERANHWLIDAAGELPSKQPARKARPKPFTVRDQAPTLGPHEPAWLLHQPTPLRIQNDRPCLDGPLQLYQGPYRIETGWWDSQYVGRDYFVALDHQAKRYWIYRVRQAMSVQWFLQGVFG